LNEKTILEYRLQSIVPDLDIRRALVSKRQSTGVFREFTMRLIIALLLILSIPAVAADKKKNKMRLGLFSAQSSRTFDVDENQSEAEAIIDETQVEDGFPNGKPPPGVRAYGGRGRFGASSAFASGDAGLTSGQDKKVTEDVQFRSLIPGAAAVAALVHRYSTDPAEAYRRAKERCEDLRKLSGGS
jgi:hypothetical protein